MSAAIETFNLTKQYGQRLAVAELSIQVAAGSITGLLGPNGAGKTTTLAMALHLAKPTAGSVAIGGIDVWQSPAQALRSVGALIEAPALLGYLNAREHLRLWAGHTNLQTDIDSLLERVGLSEAATQRVDTFSQGMRQRLGLAQALLGDPALLILDEPTLGIDPHGVVALRQTLREIAARGRTILFSSHQLAEVQQICDHVIIIDKGRCVAQGAVAELLGQGGRLLVRVEGSSEIVEAALECVRQWRGGTKARNIEGVLDILLGTTDAAALNRHLIEQGFNVAELHSQTPSLEDFFLHHTAQEAAA